jgi:hypothetical protein
MKYYSLGSPEKSRFIKIIKILFGVCCLAIAIFWVILNFTSLNTNKAVWLSVIFLGGFGLYQVFSGIGYTDVFIELGDDFIRLKKNPVLPPLRLNAVDIVTIDLFPLNVIFHLKSKRRIILRFGTTYYETSNKVKDEILAFAELNNITLKIVQEEL